MYEFRMLMPMWLALNDAASRLGQSKAVFIREAITDRIIQKLGVDLVAEYAPLQLEHSPRKRPTTRKRPLPPATKAPKVNSVQCLHCQQVLISTGEAPMRCACPTDDMAITIAGGELFERRDYGPASRWTEADGTEWENGRQIQYRSSTSDSAK